LSVSSRHDFRVRSGIALFASTLFLGAGVFSLPLEIPAVGLLPLVGAIAAVWWLSRRMYRRQADLLEGGDEAETQGDGALGATADAAGAGAAGRALSLVGMGIYVAGALVAYTILAERALGSLLTPLSDSAILLGAAVATGAGLAVALRLAPRRFVLARRMASLGLIWSLGLSAAAVAGRSAPRAVILLSVFVAGVVVAGLGGGRRGEEGSRGVRLLPQHSTAVAGLGIQLGLMAILAIAVIASVPTHFPMLIAPGGIRLRALATAAGVVVFAYVGTGLVCVTSYPQMAAASFRRQVVDTSLNIVIGVQVMWLLVAALLLSTSQLSALDASGSNTALGLGTALRGSPRSAVGAVGALVTLLAVTNAASGFSASLASEAAALGRHMGGRARRIARPGALRTTVIAAAATAAGCQITAGDIAGHSGINSILAVAGLAGGGTLVFVLPILAEGNPNSRPRSARWAFAVAVGVGAWGTALGLSDQGVWAFVAVSLAWAPLLPTALAARRISRAASAVSPTRGGAVTGGGPVARVDPSVNPSQGGSR